MSGYIGSKSSVTLVDGYNQTEADAEFVAKAGDTMSGDLSFGDNDKAIFGAGSDLQIYSDGTHSRIYESGSGLLIVRASNFNVNNADGTDSYITMQDGGAVTAYYDGSAKLATTSTGIDVTGIAVADGLTVARENLTDLKTWANDDVGSIDFYQAQNHPNANSYKRLLDINAGGENAGSIIRFLTQAGGSASAEAMRIDSSGRVTMPYQPYFAAEMNGVNSYVSSGADTNLPFNSAPYNVGGHFNASTYRFTAPVTGKYAMAVGVINDVSSPVGRLMFYVNNSADGNGVKWGINGSSTAGGGSTTASAVIWLNANDYVEVRSQSGAILNYQGNHSSWTGILVS